MPVDDVLRSLSQLLENLGPWAYAAFIAIYVLATICLIPASALTLAAGAIFGIPLGFALVSAGSLLGASAAFLIARYAARERVEEFARSSAKFRALDEAIADGGWKVVALTRLSPVLPFTWQNYFYGLTRIKFWPYVATSWIAMMPGTFMYIYFGHVAGATATGDFESTGQWILIAIGLAATVTATLYITYLARRRLYDRTAAAHQQSNDEQHQEHEKQNLRDAR